MQACIYFAAINVYLMNYLDISYSDFNEQYYFHSHKIYIQSIVYEWIIYIHHKHKLMQLWNHITFFTTNAF